jgi:hypothetical protein
MLNREGYAAVCRREKTVYAGWDAERLSNGVVTLVAVPAIGGRVMAYDLGEHAFLWNNRQLLGRLYSPEENFGDGTLASWKNYGGAKTWPAPQGWDNDAQWHGPPDPTLDTGRYTLEESNGSAIRMRSPADPRTGVQIVREISLSPGSSHVRMHLEMHNVSAQERRWSLWEIVQVDAAHTLADGTQTYNDQAWLYIPCNPASRFARGYNLMFGSPENSQWRADAGMVAVQYQFQVGKIGVDSPAGWVAFANQADQYVFCQRFHYCAGEEYPDGGASVECWTTGRGEAVGGMDFSQPHLLHMEVEILGPLRSLPPGGSQSLDIDWCVARCPGPIVNITLAGCCHKDLLVEAVGGQMRVTGVFGVFYLGQAELVWLDASGGELGVERLAEVTPHEVFTLNQLATPAAGACTVELRIAPVGTTRGELLAKTVLSF